MTVVHDYLVGRLLSGNPGFKVRGDWLYQPLRIGELPVVLTAIISLVS